jgi:CheY-like chemotaxis protein
MDLDPSVGHVTADPDSRAGGSESGRELRDAMPQGGQPTLTTRHLDGTRNTPGKKSGWSRGRMKCSISDTRGRDGRGTIAHIFEPFFTTKAVGTGLGLATAYGIIKQSEGHISVSSEPGNGTTFLIYLPRTVRAGSGPVVVEETATRRGTEVVLLSEDDANLRALTRDILQSEGYTILESRDTEDALRTPRGRTPRSTSCSPMW